LKASRTSRSNFSRCEREQLRSDQPAAQLRALRGARHVVIVDPTTTMLCASWIVEAIAPRRNLNPHTKIPRGIREREPVLRFGSGCSYAVAASLTDAT
jgi:hypothetical protein